MQLTPQELQIAQLAAAGLTNKQIAEQLFLSPRTVGSHLYRIFPRLGITTRAALRDALNHYPGAGSLDGESDARRLRGSQRHRRPSVTSKALMAAFHRSATLYSSDRRAPGAGACHWYDGLAQQPFPV